MPSGRSEGPSGKLFLYEDWSDSASGHSETTKKADLSVADGNIILTLKSEAERFPSRGSKDANKVLYSISPEKLVELIQAHGQKV